jgi:hypothetical protein
MKIEDRIEKYLNEGTQGFVKWIIKPKKKMAHLIGDNDHNLLVQYWSAANLNLPYKQAKDFIEREKPFLVPVVQSKKLRDIINKDRFDIIDVTKK